MQGDYEDAWAQGPSRRGRVCFGRSCVCDQQRRKQGWERVFVPMPLSFASVRLLAWLEALGVAWSLTIVDVDDERLNVLAKGARCVSLSSAMVVRIGAAAQTRGRDTHSW